MHFLSLLAACSVVRATTLFAGVNVAGFDFGSDITGTVNLASADPPLKVLGGNDGAGQMSHFAQQDDLNLFRLPVSWQYLINNNISVTAASSTNSSIAGNNTRALAGQLDATNFGKYNMLMQACLSTGAHCIIDIHNYARFNNQTIGQGGPTNAEFANLWRQLATIYANQTRVVFGVMNEPHDIANLTLWAGSVQAAVTAIRKAGATTQMILLPGTDFTSAETFISNGSAGNLSVVANPDGSKTGLIFDVHKYLDFDNSGTHLECVANHINDSFAPLATFLKTNNRMAMLSEIGGSSNQSCLNFMCQATAFVNANSDVYVGYAGWSAGGFDQTYNLTEVPIVNADGTFTDVPIVSQCIVGTRLSNSTTGVSNSTNAVQFAASGTSSPVPSSTSVFKGGAADFGMGTKQWAGLVGLQVFGSVFMGFL